VTLAAVLIIDGLLLSMGSGALMTTQTIVSVIGPAEILFAMRDDLERWKPREIVRLSRFRGMAGGAGPLKRLRINRRGRVSFAQNPMFSVTGVALRQPVSTPSHAMPVFLFVTFGTRNRTRSFHRSMGFILDVAMAVEAGEGRPMSRVCETLYVDPEGALFAAFLVAMDASLGSVSHRTEGGKKDGNNDDAAQLQPDRPRA
jgi:hypothetical protein